MENTRLTLKTDSQGTPRLQIANGSGKPMEMRGKRLVFVDGKKRRWLYHFPSTVMGKSWWLDPGEMVEISSERGVDGYIEKQGRFTLFLPKNIDLPGIIHISLIDDRQKVDAELSLGEWAGEKDGFVCPSCGASTELHWAICQQCGSRLVEESGKTVRGAAKGAKLKSRSPLVMFLIVLVVAAIAGGAYYVIAKPNVQAVVDRSKEAIEKLDRWKTSLKVAGEETWRQEVIEPDRYSAKVFHADGDIRETVWIGANNYTRRIDAMGNQSDWVHTEGNKFNSKILLEDILAHYIDPLRDMEGEQTGKGKKTLILSGKSRLGGKLTVYIDSKTYLPTKIEEEVSDPSGQSSNRQYVTTLEELGKDVKIEKPE